MYTINNFTSNAQKCSFCSSSRIEFIGSQAYCSDCARIISSIQQEVKIVPCLYNGNSQTKIASIDRKMLQYINQFSNKFGGVLDKQQQTFLSSQAKLIHTTKGLNAKGFRQDAAVVVYHYFKNTHKLSLKQFCFKNQLKQKPFNKSYIAYIIFKKEQENKQERPQVKQEQELLQKIQQISQNQDQIKQQKLIQKIGFEEQILDIYCKRSKEQAQNLANRIFSQLFHQIFYQQNRCQIIQKLSDKVVLLYKKIKSSFDSIAICFKERISLKQHTSYILFCVLRKLKMHISFKDYIQIIKINTGFILKFKILSNLAKLCETIQQNQSNSDGYEPQNDLITGSCSQIVKLENQSL